MKNPFHFKHPDQSPGFLLWQLTNQWQRQQRQALVKIGLTHGQFVVLANVLWLSSLPDNIVTQQQVGDHANIDKMSMSDLVTTLIQKKLLNRSPHKKDKRAYSLTLTTKGHTQVVKAIPLVENIDKTFFTSGTAKLVKLANISQRVKKGKKTPPNKDIKLTPATKKEYSTLFNLARFYAYDISEFFGDEPGWEMEDDGLYGVGIDYQKYFQDKDAHPYFIRYKNELAGFAIVDKDSIDPSADFNMAQFFVSRTYKRQGVGKFSAFQCFNKFTGTWEVHVMPKNEAAYHFWKTIINEYTNGNFYEKILKNKNNEERITFTFNSGETS